MRRKKSIKIPVKEDQDRVHEKQVFFFFWGGGGGDYMKNKLNISYIVLAS